MIKHILVPLDGSDSAFKALELACDLADKYQAKLLLLHVVPNRELPESVRHFAELEGIEGPPALVYEKVVAKNVLESGAHKAQAKGLTSVAQLTEYGDPAKTIANVAARIQADTIVMGTRGLSDIAGLVMGSVAHKVGHLAECTVISVK